MPQDTAIAFEDVTKRFGGDGPPALDRVSQFHVGDVVAFQADGFDADGGWSVLVRGRAEVASVEGGVAVRIPAEMVDGQRF